MTATIEIEQQIYKCDSCKFITKIQKTSRCPRCTDCNYELITITYNETNPHFKCYNCNICFKIRQCEIEDIPKKQMPRLQTAYQFRRKN